MRVDCKKKQKQKTERGLLQEGEKTLNFDRFTREGSEEMTKNLYVYFEMKNVNLQVKLKYYFVIGLFLTSRIYEI